MSTKTVKRKDLPVMQHQVMVIGDDFVSDAFIHKNADGSLRDLSGCTVAGEMTLADGTTVVPLTLVEDLANGQYCFTLPRATTAGYSEQVASFTAKVTDLANVKTTYFAGKVSIKNVEDGD